MLQFKPVTAQQSMRDDAEDLAVCLTGRHMEHADTTGHFFGWVITAVEQSADTASERLDMRPQQTRLQTREQMLHRQQRVHLRGVEPQPRQRIAVFVLALRIAVIPVAARVVIPEYRRRQTVTHVLKITAHRRPGYFHGFHHGPQCRPLTRAQQPVNGVETLCAIQGSRPFYAFAW